MMKQPGAHAPNMAKLRNTAIIGMALAGLIHLGLGLIARADPLAHSIFYLAVGGLQLVWSAVFWRRSGPALYWSGLTLAGGAVVLWLVSRVLPAPFASAPGDVSALGVTAALSESIAVLALTGMIVESRLAGSRKSVVLLIFGEVLALALVGVAAYAFGMAMEALLSPWGLGARHG